MENFNIQNDFSLKDVDWADIWVNQVGRTFKTQSSEFWDHWAKNVEPKKKHSGYADVLLSLIDINDNDVVIDAGCGTGALTIPLARKCKTVIALDQSQEALNVVNRRAETENLSNIKPMLANWNMLQPEDIPYCDMVIASRSLPGNSDIKKSIENMNAAAGKSCHVTWRVRGFDELDRKISEIIGIDIDYSPEHTILYNVIESMWIHPRVIPFTIAHEKEFVSLEDAFFQIVRMRDVDSPNAKKVMNLLENNLEYRNGLFYQKKTTTWVLFSWDKEPKVYSKPELVK